MSEPHPILAAVLKLGVVPTERSSIMPRHIRAMLANITEKDAHQLYRQALEIPKLREMLNKEEVAKWRPCINPGCYIGFLPSTQFDGHCLWQSGTLNLDSHSYVWEKHYEDINGSEQVNHEAYIDKEGYGDGWKWTCCGNNMDDKGCQSGNHKAAITDEGGGQKTGAGTVSSGFENESHRDTATVGFDLDKDQKEKAGTDELSKEQKGEVVIVSTGKKENKQKSGDWMAVASKKFFA